MGSLVAELAEKLSAATNSIDFDEQTMFLNTSANTVGIGTNAPASKLDVRGTVQVGLDGTGYDVVFYGDTASRNVTWDESEDALHFADNTEIKVGSLAAGDMVLYHDGTNSYIKNAVGALKIATETSGIAVTIGHTTSEVTVADNLTVTGTLTGTLATAAQGSVTSLGTLTGLTVNGATVFNENSADVDFRIESNGVQSMFKVDAGDNRVGIGIASNGSIESTLSVHFTHATEASTHGVAIYNYVNANNGIAPIWFGVTAPDEIYHKAAIGLFRKDSYGVGDLVFAVDSNTDGNHVTFASDEKMRITSAGLVGIGTSVPVTALTVEGTLTLKERAEADTNTAAYGQLWVDNTTPCALYFTTDADNDIQITSGTGLAGGFDADPGAGELTFNESGNDVDFRVESDAEVNMLFVDASSNRVGIGTNNPGTILSLWGGGGQTESIGMTAIAGEGKAAYIYFQDDEADDSADHWQINNTSAAHNSNPNMYFATHDGDWDNRMAIGSVTDVWCEGDFNGGGADYAEFFEWKEELADEAEVKSLFGMTVVLEGGKIRIAQAGEEEDILGVVRPNNVSTTGNHPKTKWKGKYMKDNWGTMLREPYTQVDWYDLDEEGKKTRRYQYIKDRIPEYEMIDNPDESRTDWETLEINFKKDADGNPIPLKVPTTNAEKVAHNYTERSEYKEHKSGGRGGTPLTRRVLNPDFDPNQEYISRDERRTEWCIVGLLGMVPVRDTAVIPTHWVKMKNLESGIDVYYIK